MKIALPEFLKDDYLKHTEVLDKSKYFVGLVVQEEAVEILNAEEYTMFKDYGNRVGDDLLSTTKSLLWLFNLIERGKQYYVFLKTNNFMVNSAGQTLGIFRKVPGEAKEVLDEEWLEEVKKLLGISLIKDKSKLKGTENLVGIAAFIEDDRLCETFVKVMDLPDLAGVTKVLIETFWPSDARRYMTIYSRVEKVDSRLMEPIVDYAGNISSDVVEGLVDEEEEAKPKRERKPKKEVVKKEKEPKVKKEIKLDLSEKVPMFTKIMMGITVLSLGFAGYMYMEGNKKSEVYQEMMDEVRYNEDFYAGVLNAATNDYTKADKNFGEFQKNNAKLVEDMEEDEKYVMLYTYVYVGEYQQALDVYNTEEAAEIVVRYLRTQNNLSEVLKLESDTNVIKFEKAAMEGNNEDIIKYGNKIDIESETVKDRIVIIAKAYVNSGDLDGALSFATSHPTTGLIESIKVWDYKYIEETEKDKKKQEQRKVEDGKKIDELLK